MYIYLCGIDVYLVLVHWQTLIRHDEPGCCINPGTTLQALLGKVQSSGPPESHVTTFSKLLYWELCVVDDNGGFFLQNTIFPCFFWTPMENPIDLPFDCKPFGKIFRFSEVLCRCSKEAVQAGSVTWTRRHWWLESWRWMLNVICKWCLLNVVLCVCLCCCWCCRPGPYTTFV